MVSKKDKDEINKSLSECKVLEPILKIEAAGSDRYLVKTSDAILTFDSEYKIRKSIDKENILRVLKYKKHFFPWRTRWSLEYKESGSKRRRTIRGIIPREDFFDNKVPIMQSGDINYKNKEEEYKEILGEIISQDEKILDYIDGETMERKIQKVILKITYLFFFIISVSTTLTFFPISSNIGLVISIICLILTLGFIYLTFLIFTIRPTRHHIIITTEGFLYLRTNGRKGILPDRYEKDAELLEKSILFYKGIKIKKENGVSTDTIITDTKVEDLENSLVAGQI